MSCTFKSLGASITHYRPADSPHHSPPPSRRSVADGWPAEKRRRLSPPRLRFFSPSFRRRRRDGSACRHRRPALRTVYLCRRARRQLSMVFTAGLQAGRAKRGVRAGQQVVRRRPAQPRPLPAALAAPTPAAELLACLRTARAARRYLHSNLLASLGRPPVKRSCTHPSAQERARGPTPPAPLAPRSAESQASGAAFRADLRSRHHRSTYRHLQRPTDEAPSRRSAAPQRQKPAAVDGSRLGRGLPRTQAFVQDATLRLVNKSWEMPTVPSS